VFGSSKLDIMLRGATPESVRMSYRDIAKPGVRVLRETITAIDPPVAQETSR
jgi:sulfide:quinone oxidoreductase